MKTKKEIIKRRREAKLYYQKNKEKIREIRKLYYQKNREKFAESQRKDWEKNKKRRMAQMKKLYLSNPQKYKDYWKEYFQKNKYYLSRYTKFGGNKNEVTKIPKECKKCKNKKEYILQWHHKDFNKKNNKASNIEVLCANCHLEIHYFHRLKTIWGKKRGV